MKVSSLQIYNFIRNDFISLWNGIASNRQNSSGNGNFIFALYPMILIEFVCDLISEDYSLLNHFSQELNKSCSQLFKVVLKKAIINQKAKLPYLNAEDKGKYLLDVLYGTIRNGHAHNYSQNFGLMEKGQIFSFALNCPNANQYYSDPVHGAKAFVPTLNKYGIEFSVYSDVLFSQICNAIESCTICILKPDLITRDKKYDFLDSSIIIRDFIDLRAPLIIHFPLRPAAKSTALRCAQSPNHRGFASFARLAQRFLARPRLKTEYLEVPLSLDKNAIGYQSFSTLTGPIGNDQS